MSDETKPAPCAICGGEGAYRVIEQTGGVSGLGHTACNRCGAHSETLPWVDKRDELANWNARQRLIREERTWQLVVALAPAAFPDLRLGGDSDKGCIGLPSMERRWRRVWEAARAGVEAPE